MKTAKRTRSVTTELFFIYFLGYILITVIVIVSIFFSLIMYEVLCGQRMYNSYFVQLESKLIEDYRSITEEDLKHINGFLVKITNQNQISYSVGNVIDEFKQVDITTYMKIFGVEEDNSVLLNSDLRSSTAFLDLNNSIIKTRKDINYSIYSMYLKEETAVVIIGCPYSEVTKPNAITRIIPHNLIIKMLSFFNVVIILLMVYLLAGLTSKVFVNPIKTLLKGVIAISNGEYDVRIESERKNEFAELSNGFNKMAETIQYETNKREELEKMREELILDVSHDLKNPLASILGYSETMINNTLTEEEKNECLQIINKNSHKANKLINDLFEFSLYNNINYRLNLAKIDVCEFIRTLIANYIPEFEYKEFEYDFDIMEGPIFILADEEKLTRAINNIFDNKIKYNEIGNKIIVKTEIKEKYFYILLSDNGEIMPGEYWERIFNPFVRVDESRNSKTGGTGLGLSITKKVILKHYGDVKIIDSLEGTTFEIKLPLINN